MNCIIFFDIFFFLNCRRYKENIEILYVFVISQLTELSNICYNTFSSNFLGCSVTFHLLLYMNVFIFLIVYCRELSKNVKWK